MTMTRSLNGPFAEARSWLLDFMAKSNIKNETLSIPLEADWSFYSKHRSSYILGVIWGRLRQMRSELEQATVYAQMVETELAKWQTWSREEGILEPDDNPDFI